MVAAFIMLKNLLSILRFRIANLFHSYYSKVENGFINVSIKKIKSHREMLSAWTSKDQFKSTPKCIFIIRISYNVTCYIKFLSTKTGNFPNIYHFKIIFHLVARKAMWLITSLPRLQKYRNEARFAVAGKQQVTFEFMYMIFSGIFLYWETN